MKKVVRDIIDEATSDPDSQRTVIHHILGSNLPPVEKATDRIYDEVFTLMSAGYVSTAYCLRIILYHIYRDRGILARLRSEAEDARRVSGKDDGNNSGAPDLSTLERLPYLTAVIMEGLRLGPAIASRSARVAPDRDIQYGKWRIPTGTPVGMTTLLLHTDDRLYPEAKRFAPDRWMDPNNRKRAEKTLAPFSRGTRICLGMQYVKTSPPRGHPPSPTCLKWKERRSKEEYCQNKS